MEKWEHLLAQLEILSCGQEIFSEEELRNAEAKAGFVFPLEYKRFCQVFGTGMFGQFIGISCPTDYWLESSRVQLEAIRYDILNLSSNEQSQIMNMDPILELLDAAFIFGDDSGAHVALWDLRTYSESDLSYDIYWMASDEFDGNIYRIGRNFFEFVRDFCLGNKAYEILPCSMHPSQGAIYLTFTRSSTSQINPI